jgi:hypothetical protein
MTGKRDGMTGIVSGVVRHPDGREADAIDQDDSENKRDDTGNCAMGKTDGGVIAELEDLMRVHLDLGCG